MNPEAVDIRGDPVTTLGVLNHLKNSFHIGTDTLALIVKQPELGDFDAMKAGRGKIDRDSWERYAPYSTTWDSLQQIVDLPTFQRGAEGTLYMIIILDDEVIGFTSHEYRGIGASRFVIGGLCITPSWRKRGIGSLYGKLSEYIAVFNRAHEFHGQTRYEEGMWGIRKRDGWTLKRRPFVVKGHVIVDIKKVLPKSLQEARRAVVDCEVVEQ